jgi:hypothetical protein
LTYFENIFIKNLERLNKIFETFAGTFLTETCLVAGAAFLVADVFFSGVVSGKTLHL